MTPNTASIVITTKNRKNELRTALRSAVAQTGDIEIMVVDDGSDDGTADMVHGEFPQVRLERFECSSGYIVQRNRAAAMASGEIVVSIDDDAEFSSPSIVADTLADFIDPRIAGVAIPYVEPHKSDVVRQLAPDRTSIWLAGGYIGTAHALRRETFLQLGGYKNFFVHQGEEIDFFMRLLDAGYFVRFGSTQAPIVHYESVRRDTRKIDFLARRNDILFPWLNVPWPYLPVHMLAATVNGMRTAASRNPTQMLAGLAAGYAACVAQRKARAPVAPNTYRLARRLRKGGPMRLDEARKALSLPATSITAERQTNVDDGINLPSGRPR